ncbi:glycosyltransferase family 2 protein [Methylobacterium sp. SD274]|uniref:glycosyltransferase family 2 protein n=1 Tax=Methylobacterium sp. SD274 TaxID=2782009 RepID=UPI001A95DECB|nr:glycosyltransferase family 2 protein [Methylobacterium sp. SD274]MBO1020551.1 glycosyltransferase family 2 protein [Methylobacterium sp. SD274]
MSAQTQTIAGIVIYHPDQANLLRLVGVLAPDVREIVIYANSAFSQQDEETLRAAAHGTDLSVMRPGSNLGLGVAYNVLLDHATKRGAPFLLLLDQDSLPPPGAIPRLAALHARLATAGKKPAIVGPRPTDWSGKPLRSPPEQEGGRDETKATRVQFVISSGSLMNCEVARAVGPFRADFFIDAIDVEWCMRANHRGYSIWIADDVPMAHELGRGRIRLPFGLTPTDQPPRRLYTFLRNQLAMLRMSHVPPAHKARTLLLLPLRIVVYLGRNRFSSEVRTALWRGLIDGACAKLGPPEAALARSALRQDNSAKAFKRLE